MFLLRVSTCAFPRSTDYDFGDCCEATCGVDSSGTLDESSCSDFWCIDPQFATPSPTPAPLSSECLDDRECADGARGPSVDDPGARERATTQGAIAATIVTAFNLSLLTYWKKGEETDVVHCYLLLMAYALSVTEGIWVILLVPNSKEYLKIGAVFFFGAVAALSGFLLRQSGRHGTFAVVNAGLEAVFAVVVLFVFVEKSTRNIFVFGIIAGNEALVGLAIAARVDSRSTSDENAVEATYEIAVVVGEAVGDILFPLTATLIQSLFHSDSAWRSDFVFTWWAITGFANTAALCMCFMPPVSRIAFGPKLACLSQVIVNLLTGIMAFVILTLTKVNITNPPTFDVVWSSVVGAGGVMSALVCWKLFEYIRHIPDGESIADVVRSLVGALQNIPDGQSIADVVRSVLREHQQGRQRVQDNGRPGA